MIVLDTNVISELMRDNPNPLVVKWINQQVKSSLYLCSVVLAELLTGIEALPTGKRKSALSAAFADIRKALFSNDRVLAFEEETASLYAKLVTQAQSLGAQISVGDGQIAAIALQHGFAVATRDTAPFVAAGVEVIDPWSTT